MQAQAGGVKPRRDERQRGFVVARCWVPFVLAGGRTVRRRRLMMTFFLVAAAVAPADVLRSVNRGLLEYNLSGMFVTLLYGVLDPRGRHGARAQA